MFTTKNEASFLFAEIDKTKKVLEYGSGISTIEIAKKCLEIISIEHQQNWFNRCKKLIPNNCTVLLKKPNLPYKEGGHCGTYEEFKDYIEAPLGLGPFDVIFIDGRARLECAKVCKQISHPDTIIFVHDFNRPEYKEMLNYLVFIGIIENMAKFKIK